MSQEELKRVRERERESSKGMDLRDGRVLLDYQHCHNLISFTYLLNILLLQYLRYDSNDKMME